MDVTEECYTDAKHNFQKSQGNRVPEEGRWGCYFEYIGQNCFSYSLCMQCTNSSHLAVVDCQEVMAAR